MLTVDMNVFEKAIRERGTVSENELKRLFWTLAKKLHPDAAGVEKSHDRFIKLKEDFDTAITFLREGKTFPDSAAPTAAESGGIPNRQICLRLFIDLIAGNFPVDRSIRDQKAYLARIEQLNTELSKFGSGFLDLFKRFEVEMYSLKGKTTISNHEFAVVKLYFYRFSSFTYSYTKQTESYLRIGYDLVHDILKRRNMDGSIKFVNWLVEGIVGKEKLKT